MITNKKFPKGKINIVNQSGTDLTEPEAGLEVNLHWRDGVPVCAEISRLTFQSNDKTVIKSLKDSAVVSPLIEPYFKYVFDCI